MENDLNENSGGLDLKKSTVEVLQRWRSLSNVVKNPKRRFLFTANPSETAAMRRSNQEKLRTAILVSKAAFQYINDISQGESEAVPLVETTSVKSSLRKIYKYAGLGELPASFLRFGPVYCDAGDDALDSAKEEAWKHVLDKFPNGDQDRNRKTEDIYLGAFERVEEEARACYADATLNGLSESQFQWMMIKDGCFFLQLVLFILGASKELGYPDDHITFGTKQGRKVVHGWIKCMFHVGNQIPLVVLSEFMKQDFFQDIIVKHGKWERPAGLLSKRVLYDLLVVPATLYANGHRASSSIQCEVPGNNNISEPEEQPSDLLHGLQNLVLGPKISRNDSIKDDDDDEEEEEEGRDDLEAGATASTDHEVSNAGNDSEEFCVSALRRKGIYFWKSNGDGIRGIQFKNRMLFPGLHLPTVPLNQETELLFRNLKKYEMCQRQNEVRSFLGLMQKLISTQEDIKHLASKGILEVSKPQYGVKFIRMLQDLSETVTSRDHQHVLQQLRDHSSNFRCVKFKKVAMIVLILTAAQTVFGILSYAVSLRQSHA